MGILHQTLKPPGVADSTFLLTLGLYPVFADIPTNTRLRIPPYLWPELAERHKTESLRQLAKEYGVSHEAIRRTLAVIRPQTKLAET